MDIKLLQTFLSVAETENFHRSADRLNITQAAVSSRIRALEAELGVELFLRGQGGTQLSRAGKQLRPYAQQMLASWQQVANTIGHQFSNRISLRIGSQLSIWDPLLVELTIWIEETLGKLPLTLNFDHESNAIELVRKQIVDLTITDEAAKGMRLTSVSLPPEQMILVADRPCQFSDTDLPLFINFQLGSQYEAAVFDLLGDRSGHIFLGNTTMGLHYLYRRGGMAFCPHRMVADDLQKKRLFPVTGIADFALNYYAVYDPNSASASLIEQVLPGLLHISKT